MVGEVAVRPLLKGRPGATNRWRQQALRMVEPWFYLSPALLFILVCLVVPLVLGVSYSFYQFGAFRSEFVGFEQYRRMLSDAELGQALLNTLWWTAASLVLQLTLGLGLALLLNEPFIGRPIVQAVVFLPWAVPSFLSGLSWSWLFNPVIGPIPHWFHGLGIMAAPTNILADPATAMWGPIVANVWFGIPFFAITLLAALKSIPGELYEAAAIDGADSIRRFFFVTLPYLAPTIAISVMLRTIWIATFADLIYVMTAGGPAGATHTVATYIYVTAFKSLDKGYASAVAMLLLALLVFYAAGIIKLKRTVIREA
jgi:multiple sugar transport system permease protein